MPAQSLHPLLLELRRGLTARADPERAPAMQAYMKSEMPFHGVGAQVLRTTCRDVFATVSFPTFEEWQDTLLALWRQAEFREERYAVIELSGHPIGRKFQTMRSLPIYEEIVLTGAWWDFVDTVAKWRLGNLLRNAPRGMSRQMRIWSRDESIWKRRSTILCQLTFKDKTDLGLLYDCIAPSMEEAEFFLRKAIGWALREYAKTDPVEVLRYVAVHRERLSGLSKREAVRHVLKSGIPAGRPAQ